jgi:hypothetical protein
MASTNSVVGGLADARVNAAPGNGAAMAAESIACVVKRIV